MRCLVSGFWTGREEVCCRKRIHHRPNKTFEGIMAGECIVRLTYLISQDLDNFQRFNFTKENLSFHIIIPNKLQKWFCFGDGRFKFICTRKYKNKPINDTDRTKSYQHRCRNWSHRSNSHYSRNRSTSITHESVIQ